MKKPSLRVTEWLGDIPVGKECTACADIQFQITPASPHPKREEYKNNLRLEFERHFKQIHKRESPKKKQLEELGSDTTIG